MNIKNQLNEKADYVSPKCKAAAVSSSRVMCQSPYGEVGKAGAVGYLYDNSSEEDY